MIEQFVEFHVTGILRNGNRFKDVYADGKRALRINLWQGSVWGVTDTGKRKLLKRVYN